MDKLLKIYGVPARYHDVARDFTGDVRGFSMDQKWRNDKKCLQIGVPKQREVMARLLNNPPRQGVVGIGTVPTDSIGMAFAATVVRSWIQRDRSARASMIDLAGPPDKQRPSGLTVLHNVTNQSHPMRVQICRDFLVRLDGTLRIVVVGGIDPVEFFYKRLHYPLDYALYFEGDYADL